MAVPTITTISPNSGHVRGRYVVAIIGENFALPHPPPDSGPCGPWVPSVAVAFGGVSCRERSVKVRTDPANPATGRIIYCEVPAHAAGVVDVTVQNLDSDGAAIAGESATAEDSYTYQRPDLTRDSTIVRVLRTLADLVKEQVVDEVVLSVSTDYDATPGDGALQVSVLPCVVLAFHDLPFNYARGTGENETEQDTETGIGVAYKTPDTVDMEFTVLGVTAHTGQCLNLLEAVVLFFHDNRQISVARDADDESRGTRLYKLRSLGAAKVDTGANNSNVRSFRWEWVIEAVDIETWDVVEMTGIVEAGDKPVEVLPPEQTGESAPVGVNPPNEHPHI